MAVGRTLQRRVTQRRGAVALIACAAALLFSQGASGQTGGAGGGDGEPLVPATEAALGERSRLTLGEVLDSARRHYPLLLAAAQKQWMAEGEALAAAGAFDFQLGSNLNATPLGYYDAYTVDVVGEQPTTLWGTKFYAGYRLTDGNIALYDGKRETLDAGEVRAGFAIPLLRDGPIDQKRLKLQKALIGQEIAGFDVDLKRLETLRDAADAYWKWVAAGQKFDVAERLLSIAVARDQQIAARVRSGDLPEIESVDNERVIIERRERLVAAERSLQEAAIKLSLYYRDGEGRPVVPRLDYHPPTFPLPREPEERAFDAGLRRAMLKRPEVQALTRALDAVEFDVEYARNRFLPDLSLKFEASKDIGSGPKSLDPTRIDTYLTFSLPIPLREARGSTRAAESKREAVSAELRYVRDAVTAQVQDARSAVAAAFQRVELARRATVLALRLEDAERKRFEFGQSTILIVNLREQASADAASKEVDALYAFYAALATFAAASAGEVSREGYLAEVAVEGEGGRVGVEGR